MLHTLLIYRRTMTRPGITLEHVLCSFTKQPDDPNFTIHEKTNISETFTVLQKLNLNTALIL